MQIISSNAIAEKNKLNANSVWVVLLEIQISQSLTIRLAANNENITWNGQTWYAFPFTLDTVGETGKGEIPTVQVSVSNVTGEILTYLEQADGANNSPVIIRVINTEASSNNQAELELSYVLHSTSFDQSNIKFDLTGAACLTRRVPTGRYLKNFCRFKYNDANCGVSASVYANYPKCDHTFGDCQTRQNSARFGGFPWMPTK